MSIAALTQLAPAARKRVEQRAMSRREFDAEGPVPAPTAEPSLATHATVHHATRFASALRSELAEPKPPRHAV